MPSILPDSGEALSRYLVSDFLAELMAVSRDAPTPGAFQGALQAYCDGLRPWLEPADYPVVARPRFPLVEDSAMDEATDTLSLRLSPEGQAFFRAWVRRKAALPPVSDMPHAWTQ
jgi:hypothetical protein